MRFQPNRAEALATSLLRERQLPPLVIVVAAAPALYQRRPGSDAAGVEKQAALLILDEGRPGRDLDHGPELVGAAAVGPLHHRGAVRGQAAADVDVEPAVVRADAVVAVVAV